MVIAQLEECFYWSTRVLLLCATCLRALENNTKQFTVSISSVCTRASSPAMVVYLPAEMDPWKDELHAIKHLSDHATTSTSDDDGVVELTTDADYAPQERRLAQYFRTASLMSSALPVAIYSLHSTSHVTWLHVVMLSFVAIPNVTVNFIPMVLTWKTQTALPTRHIDRRRLDKLCMAVYASILLLMIAPLSLLILFNMAYVLATIPLLPAAVVFYLLLRKGTKLRLGWGTAQFGPHDYDLRCFFQLAAGITIPAYAGLFGYVLSHFRSRAHGDVNDVECLVLYSIAAGLTMMLLTSAPPALYFRQTREVLVNKFLGVLAYVQLGLVCLAGLMAATEIVRGFVVWAFAADIVVACVWFAREYKHEPDHGGEHNAKPRLADASQEVLPLVVNSFAFTVLMGFYSAHVGGHAFGWQKKACVVAVVAVLVSNLSRLVLQCKATDVGSVAFAVAMSRKATNFLVVIAAISTVMVMVGPPVTLASLARLLG